MAWFRSSRAEVFCKKGVLGNFAKFTGKHLCQSLFFNKVAGFRPEAPLKPCWKILQQNLFNVLNSKLSMKTHQHYLWQNLKKILYLVLLCNWLWSPTVGKRMFISENKNTNNILLNRDNRDTKTTSIEVTLVSLQLYFEQTQVKIQLNHSVFLSITLSMYLLAGSFPDLLSWPGSVKYLNIRKTLIDSKWLTYN